MLLQSFYHTKTKLSLSILPRLLYLQSYYYGKQKQRSPAQYGAGTSETSMPDEKCYKLAVFFSQFSHLSLPNCQLSSLSPITKKWQKRTVYHGELAIWNASSGQTQIWKCMKGALLSRMGKAQLYSRLPK